MSAIAAVFSRHDADRSPDEITSMLKMMASRRPDGERTWASRRITFGPWRSTRTPVAVDEQMPLLDRETGNVIVADVRLDNRDEPTARLGLSGHRAAELGE